MGTAEAEAFVKNCTQGQIESHGTQRFEMEKLSPEGVCVGKCKLGDPSLAVEIRSQRSC